MSRVFISYAREDSEFIDQLVAELDPRGFPVWLDRDAIGGGAAWRAAISQAIRDCAAFLVVLSPQAVASKNVAKELSLADEHGRPIIPVRFQECAIPSDVEYQLAGLQWVDFGDRPFAQAMDALVKALASVRPATTAATVTATANEPKTADTPKAVRRSPPPPEPPVETPQPTGLTQILPGQWTVQISNPYMGPIGQVTLEMTADGQFRGQIMGPTGVLMVQGGWVSAAMNQLTMQGQQSNGFQTMPYFVLVQFTQVTPRNLSGATPAGELLVWQKMN